MTTGRHVLLLAKNGEKYLFRFDEHRALDLILQFRAWALDPELEFSWFDAAMLTARVRAIENESQARKNQSDDRGYEQ